MADATTYQYMAETSADTAAVHFRTLVRSERADSDSQHSEVETLDHQHLLAALTYSVGLDGLNRSQMSLMSDDLCRS